MLPRLACLLVAFTMAGAAKAETLNLSSYIPTGHPLVSQGITEWAADVEEATAGRVKIRILPSALGKPEAHFQMARDGIADIALGIPGYTPGRFILTWVGGVPNLGNSGVGLSVGLWRAYEAFPEMQAEFDGVRTLGVFSTSPMHFFNIVRQIDAVEDFRGMKARSAGGLMTDIETALGMVPLLQPAGKSYELLSSGVADAVINPTETVKSLKLDSVVSYGTIVPGGLTAAPIFLVMNPAKFEALPPEDQEALMSVSGEHLSRIIGGVWDANDKAGLDALKAAGADVAVADPALSAAIFEAAQPAVDSWVAQTKAERGVDGNVILAKLRKEIAAVEAE